MRPARGCSYGRLAYAAVLSYAELRSSAAANRGFTGMSSAGMSPEVSSRSAAAQESKANWRLERSSRSMTGGSSSGSGWGSGAAYVGSCGMAYAGALLGAWRCAAAARNAAVSDGSLAGRGTGAALRVVCTMGRVAKSSAGTDAGAGVAEGAGFALVERTPPPMSSSAVQGRSLITSSRLNANRSSSPSSNAFFACLAVGAVPPWLLRDALLDLILSRPFELSSPSIIWNLPCHRCPDSRIQELVLRGGWFRRVVYLSSASALASLR